MRKLIYFTSVFYLAVASVKAQETDTFTIEQEAPVNAPVIVFGSANEGNGRHDSVLLEQDSGENPLGNPIQASESENQGMTQADLSPMPVESQKISSQPVMIQENLSQNPQLSPQESPQIVNKQIQDTLYESGGRIYDVQSYPVSDVDYIEKPNLNQAITTYPPI